MLRLMFLASVVPLAIAALFARGEFFAGPRACIDIAGTSVQIAALSWQAHRHVGFTSDPSRATVRVRISGDAEAADFTVIYLSRDGPADYRIFVSSKRFSPPDAAALIGGGGREPRRIEATSL